MFSMNPRIQSVKALLNRLGVENNYVFEAIVTTCSVDGTPNAAPMGIRFVSGGTGDDEKKVLIKPFNSTTTYRNLSTEREAVINISSDLAIFYESAFKRQVRHDIKSKIAFNPSKTVKPPRLKGCDAYLEVSVESVTDDISEENNRSQILCHVKSIHLQNPRAKLYCRAPYVLFEAIVHATRVNQLRSQGLADQADELMRLIERYCKLIQRLAPSSRYEEIAKELVKMTLRGKDATRPQGEEKEEMA